MTDLDRLLELYANFPWTNSQCDEAKSLKSQLESDLNEYKKIKKVLVECDLITESGNIFIPDLKGLKEGHMVVVDRDEYETNQKLAQEYLAFQRFNNFKDLEHLQIIIHKGIKDEEKANQYTQLVKAIQDRLAERQKEFSDCDVSKEPITKGYLDGIVHELQNPKHI